MGEAGGEGGGERVPVDGAVAMARVLVGFAGGVRDLAKGSLGAELMCILE